MDRTTKEKELAFVGGPAGAERAEVAADLPALDCELSRTGSEVASRDAGLE